MKQVFSFFQENQKGTKYIEYTLHADEYNLINYFYSLSCHDALSKKLKNILKNLSRDEIINLKEISELSLRDNRLYSRNDLIEMIKDFFACYQIEKTFELKKEDLSTFRRAIALSTIGSQSDVEQFDENMKAATHNTKVMNRSNIYFEGIKPKGNRKQNIVKPVVYEKKYHQKKTS